MGYLSKEKNLTSWIIAISILLPLAIGILFYAPKIHIDSKFTFLPAFHALLNGTTSIILILAVRAIKNKNRVVHQKLMKIALGLSIAFLISYIVYHSTSEPTKYGGEGLVKSIYYFILLTHIVLAGAIVPIVLITYLRAFTQNFEKHKTIARWTFPLWLYVTITGVIVYFMIAPYY